MILSSANIIYTHRSLSGAVPIVGKEWDEATWYVIEEGSGVRFVRVFELLLRCLNTDSQPPYMKAFNVVQTCFV